MVRVYRPVGESPRPVIAPRPVPLVVYVEVELRGPGVNTENLVRRIGIEVADQQAISIGIYAHALRLPVVCP